MMRLFVWLLALGVLGAICVAAAVAYEAQDLPSFDEMKSSQNGQTIVVRARDGTQLVALGPSYGKWLRYNQIPQVMKDAIVSTEDRRFREHIGIDPIGHRALAGGADAKRALAPGRIDADSAAGAQCVPQQQPHLWAQGPARRCWRWRWNGGFPRTRSSSCI